MYLMNNIDHIQYNYFPIDNQYLDLLYHILNNEHTIDISNYLLVLDQVVVLNNMYDMIYHNHHIIKVFLHQLFYHNIHIQYNQDNANLYQ
jgi:hypothetical protein